MIARYKHNHLVLILASFGILFISLFYLLPSYAGQDAKKCFDTWNDEKSETERKECLQIKPTLMAEVDAQVRQTGIARATANPQPTVIGPIKEWLPDWDTNGIKRIDLSLPEGGGPQQLRGVNSLWDDGSVPNATMTEWSPLKVYAKPASDEREAVLGTFIMGGGPAEHKLYDREWVVPKELGTIEIIGITGIPKVVTQDVFPGPPKLIQVRGSTGKTAIFDLKTQLWNVLP